VLLEFEVSIRLQYRIDNILENGTRNKESLEDVMKIFEEVHPRWKILLVEEQRREDEVYESGEGAYLRRFSPAWVYTRIIHKATNVLGRFKMHEQEHEVLTELLDQRLFHTSRRGIWYQRKAILEEHYLAAIQADFVRLNSFGQDQLKKHWKRMSLKTCEEGLQDRDCHIIYHYDLQKRIGKLEKALRIPKSQQHDFSHLNLYKPFETNIEGIQIRYISAEKTSAAATEKRGTKTVWIDETESGGECSVESMCLSWYRTQGWKGEFFQFGLGSSQNHLYMALSICHSISPSPSATSPWSEEADRSRLPCRRWHHSNTFRLSFL
jgi:Fanconi-associated nuclease 1